MGVIQFDIRHPNGQREAAIIEGERALIGSGAHCDVRLPMDQAAYEHILIEVIGGSVRADAKASQPPATLNNMPLQSSAVAPDAVLGVGNVRLFVAWVPEIGGGAQIGGAGAAQKKKKEDNPAVILGLVAVFAVVAYFLMSEEEAAFAPPPEQTPELFSNEPVSCPRADVVQAVAYGQEQMDLANGKRERMPFSVTDGVEAVKLYDVAASCFRLGQVASSAADAEEAGRTLRDDLNNDFRARRFRLAYTLKVQDYPLARDDLKVLLAMTRGKKGPFVDWLTMTLKQLPAPKKKGAK